MSYQSEVNKTLVKQDLHPSVNLYIVDLYDLNQFKISLH